MLNTDVGMKLKGTPFSTVMLAKLFFPDDYM